jgi:hypothetical protein
MELQRSETQAVHNCKYHDTDITSDRSGGRIDPVRPALPHRDSGDAVQKIGMPIVVRDVHYSVCGSGSVRALV